MTGALLTGVAAEAKVNLALAVTARRPDGYHELRSIFLRIRLADTLAIAGRDGAPQGADELVIEGDPGCPVDDNLVLLAIQRFRSEAATGIPALHARLSKRIPMAAGLAGGSSDAAATLRLLAERFPGAIPGAEMAVLASSIGADVPFFLEGVGAALVSGVGEDVEPLPSPIEPLGVLLITPPVGSPTPRVFEVWDAMGANPDRGTGASASAVDALAHLLRSGARPADVVALAPDLRTANDLWNPAVQVTPALLALRDALEARLDRPILLTGSGSTLFALYPDPVGAQDAATHLLAEPSLKDLRIVATASTGSTVAPITTRRGS